MAETSAGATRSAEGRHEDAIWRGPSRGPAPEVYRDAAAVRREAALAARARDRAPDWRDVLPSGLPR